MTYTEFLHRKSAQQPPEGLRVVPSLHAPCW